MLLVAVGLFALKGALRGFFREACGLLALAAGVAATVLYGAELGRVAAARWGVDATLARVSAHAVLFLGPFLALHAAGLVLRRLGRAARLGGADRAAGAAFGMLTGVLLAGAGLSVAAHSGWGASWIGPSRLAGPLTAVFHRAVEWAAGP